MKKLLFSVAMLAVTLPLAGCYAEPAPGYAGYYGGPYYGGYGPYYNAPYVSATFGGGGYYWHDHDHWR